MKPYQRAAVAAFAVATAALCPGPARAAEPACPGMTVEASLAFRERWQELLESVRGDFSARRDVDTCARVALALESGELIGVTVTLPDGRAASRTVTRPDDVIPTLQALLLVPERPEPIPVPAAKRPAPARPARRPQPALTPGAERDEAASPPTARDLGIELSVLAGARAGDGQFGAGIGALSLLELSGWLIGFEGRVDGYRPLEGGDPESVLELGALAGRRFDLGGVALDLTAGPAIAMKGFALSETEVVRADNTTSTSMPPPPPESVTEPDPGPVPRLLLGARLGFSPRSVVRTFVGVDGEIGPAPTPSEDPSAGNLPRFSVGLALGATVGTR